MKYFFIIAFFFINSTFLVYALDDNFTPHGEMTAKIHVDYHQGFGNNNQTYSNNKGFELTRAYFGYKYFFSPFWSMKFILDADDPNAGNLTEVAYVKNAQLSYEKNNICFNIGIIGLNLYSIQENFWGYRYVYKSAMDRYKFGNSADAGFSFKYDFKKYVSLDVCMTNGEGYKKQQDIEGNYRFGGGLTLKPSKELLLRAYYDYFVSPVSSVGANRSDQHILSSFIGYKLNSFSIGSEFDLLNNYQFDEIDDRYIVSIFTNYTFNSKYNVFARYDYMNADDVWSSQDVLICGVEFSPVKGIKISPNFRRVNYKKSNSPNGGFLYVNFEFGF